MMLNAKRLTAPVLLISAVMLLSAFKSPDPAQFPGGISAWKIYLLRNANLAVLNENQAPSRTYAVPVSFDVAADGNISNIIAETKPGYGTEDEVVRLISNAPKWQPIKKNASSAVTHVKQIIKFTVTKERSALVEVDSITVQ